MNLEQQLATLVQRGELAAAEQLCQQALASNPGSVQATDFLARLALHRGEVKQALLYVEKIINSDLSEEPLRYLKLHAELSGKLGNWTAALKGYRDVFNADSYDFEAGLNVISLLMAKGQLAETRDYAAELQEALTTAAHDDLVRYDQCIGSCIYRVTEALKENRARELHDAFSAISQHPENHFLLSDVSFMFAMAALRDAIGDYPRALEYYRTANQLKRGAAPYDVESHVRQIEQILGAFGAEFLAKGARLEEVEGPVPIFILGMPRTGSTLLEQMLGAHSQVNPLGELPALHNALANVLPLANEKGWDFNKPHTLDEVFFRSIRDRYLDEVSPGNAAYFTDKMPWNLLYVWLIVAMFPSARIFCTTREKFPTVMSCFTSHFASTLRFTESLSDAAKMYDQFERLAAAWEPHIQDRWMRVNYESLVSQPEEQVRRALDFSGLPFEDACLRPEAAERKARTVSLFQVDQPVYDTGNQRWQPYLDLLDEEHDLFGVDC